MTGIIPEKKQFLLLTFLPDIVAHAILDLLNLNNHLNNPYQYLQKEANLDSIKNVSWIQFLSLFL